jgi:cysteine-rich repeat protein
MATRLLPLITALSLTSLAVAAGCGEDAEPVIASAGTSGKGVAGADRDGASSGGIGAGARAAGGSAGTVAGSAGDDPASGGGEAAETAGATAGGGSAGTDSVNAGSGGDAGDAPAVCGDGVLQAGEECDDANDKYGDGCFACRSTQACDACWQGKKDPCLIAGLSDYCFSSTDPHAGGAIVTDGPGAGSTRAQLCSALISCAFRNGCSNGPVNDLVSRCWCGRTDGTLTDCDTAPPTGPCKDVFEAAAEPPIGGGFLSWAERNLTSPDTALGFAGLLLQCQSSCTMGNLLGCAAACEVTYREQPSVALVGGACTPYSSTGCPIPGYACNSAGTACVAVACASGS